MSISIDELPPCPAKWPACVPENHRAAYGLKLAGATYAEIHRRTKIAMGNVGTVLRETADKLEQHAKGKHEFCGWPSSIVSSIALKGIETEDQLRKKLTNRKLDVFSLAGVGRKKALEIYERLEVPPTRVCCRCGGSGIEDL